MKQRIVLYAADGTVLTNGQHYGKIIFLADGVSPTTYYEIAETEYQTMINKQEQDTGGSI